MTITVDLRPEVQAELARQAAEQGRAIESVAADLLAQAIQLPVAAPDRRTGQLVINAFKELRGLLTEEEVDRVFRRNPSTARPIDLS